MIIENKYAHIVIIGALVYVIQIKLLLWFSRKVKENKHVEFFYNGKDLKVLTMFTDLGVKLSVNGCFFHDEMLIMTVILLFLSIFTSCFSHVCL